MIFMTLYSKNLLVISHRYSNFQKDPIDLVSSYFNSVHVLVRFNSFADISKYIPIPRLKPFISSSKIDYTNKPLNLEVDKTSICYLPLDSQYKRLGILHLKAVESLIAKKNIKFDLIHSHFIWSSGYVGAKLKEKYNVPLVVTAHGYDIYELPFKDDDWKANIEYVLNSADYILTVSESNLKCITKLNINTPVKVLPNGYRRDLFYPQDQNRCRKLLDLPVDKKIILAVGNLEKIKGHRYLVEAIGKLLQRRKDHICIILGDGLLRNSLKKQIKSTGLENYVKLVDSKPHNQISLWMNACDIFVLPSLRESFGVVQIEAMACGKPVVATYNGGSEQIIISEKYGLLCTAGDSDALCNMIEIAMDKNWDKFNIINYATTYSWDNIIKEALDIYEKV
jgi:Glycosyltransferase